ncbi:MAG: 30S ribosomal protein S20 [Actinomycetota bacterium]|nr:30S ribosomal protein S20 [Actinomycetota bacterium]
MPNIKSQKKRLIKSRESRARNKSAKSALKTKVKKFRAACEEGDATKAAELFRDASRSFDKAVSKGILHKNKAANEKSRLARALNSLNS